MDHRRRSPCASATRHPLSRIARATGLARWRRCGISAIARNLPSSKSSASTSGSAPVRTSFATFWQPDGTRSESLADGACAPQRRAVTQMKQLSRTPLDRIPVELWARNMRWLRVAKNGRRPMRIEQDIKLDFATSDPPETLDAHLAFGGRHRPRATSFCIQAAEVPRHPDHRCQYGRHRHHGDGYARLRCAPVARPLHKHYADAELHAFFTTPQGGKHLLLTGITTPDYEKFRCVTDRANGTSRTSASTSPTATPRPSSASSTSCAPPTRRSFHHGRQRRHRRDDRKN